jgi:hypothetical protein
MDPATLSSVAAIVTVVGVAAWRFSRLETHVKHNHHCNQSLVKVVSRVSSRQKKYHAMLEKHINDESNKLNEIYELVKETSG